MSGGGRGISSYAPPARSPIETTATVPPRSVAAARPAAHNGATIIVGTSDTLDGLAKRYNVSAAAILQANGYKGPRVLSPGQQLIIPRQTAVAAAPAPALAPPASKPVAAAAGPSSVHIVNRGDTLMSIARRNHVPVAELARANNLDQSAKLSLGMKLHRARFEDRGRCASDAACRRSTRPAGRRGCGADHHQDGRSRQSAERADRRLRPSWWWPSAQPRRPAGAVLGDRLRQPHHAAVFKPGTVSFMPRLKLAELIEIVGRVATGTWLRHASVSAPQLTMWTLDAPAAAATGLLVGGASASAGAAQQPSARNDELLAGRQHARPL